MGFTMNTSIISMRPEIGKKKQNIQRMTKYINQNNADLYVFGEMTLTGYPCKDDLHQLAESLDGPSIIQMKKVAEKTDSYIVFGLPLKDEKRKGVLYNGSVLVHPDGKVDAYHKWFLPTFGPFEEKIFYNEGEHLPVFSTSFGRIGLMICYDLFFPEIPRAYAFQGADIIICISAAPSVNRKYFETLLPARAIENTTFIIYANIVGAQENLVFWGGSQAYDPIGNLIVKAPYFKESVISCNIDMNLIAPARINRPVIRDIRPQIYNDLYDYSRYKK